MMRLYLLPLNEYNGVPARDKIKILFIYLFNIEK